MRHILTTKRYRKSLKRLRFDTRLLDDLARTIDLLAQDKSLPPKLNDHALVGNLKQFRELHLRPDILLVYQKEPDEELITLYDIGLHANLFL